MSEHARRGAAGGRKGNRLVAAALAGRTVVLLLFCFLLLKFPAEGTSTTVLAGLAWLLALAQGLWAADVSGVKGRMRFDQLWLDHVVLGLALVLTGGLQSRVWLLYPVVFLSAMPGLTRLQGLHTVLFTFLVYAALVIVRTQGLLPSSVSIDPAPFFHTLGRRGLVLAMVSLPALLLRGSRRLSESREWLAAVFRPVRFGVLVLDGNDRIAYLNPWASRLVLCGEEELHGCPIQAIRTRPLADNLSDGPQIIPFRRRDGTLFRALYEQAPLPLPDARGRLSTLALLIDLTSICRDCDADRTLESRHFVEGLMNTIADGIRNPLTAITSSVQLLRRLDRTPAEGWSRDHEQTFSAIEHEAARLDRLIERVVLQSRLKPGKVDKLFETLNNAKNSSPALHKELRET